MVTAFEVAADLGPDLPLAVVVNILDDVRVVGDLSLEIAAYEASVRAANYAETLLLRRGPRAVLEAARRRELPGAKIISVIEQADRLEDEAPFGINPRWFYRAGSPEFSYFLSRRLLTARYADFSRLMRDLDAAVLDSTMERDAVRVRILTYQNPLSVELFVSGSVSAASLVVLANMIRRWPAQRREEAARARAEERIQEAVARDAEDEVRRRAEMRSLIVRQMADGSWTLTQEQIFALLSDNAISAISRLADREVEIRELEGPTGAQLATADDERP